MKKLAATIFFDALILMLLGLVLVMSASTTYSVFKFESVFYLFNSHLGKVGLGFLCMVIFSAIPYEYYKEFAKPIIILTAIVLVITLIVAPSYKGAARWLNLGFISFQPADAAKLALIIYLAAFIEDRGEQLKDFKEGFMVALGWTLLIAVLILIQPNFSNAALILVLSLTILLIGGARIKHILLSGSLLAAMALGSVMIFFSHARTRILSYIEGYFFGGELHLQIKQALFGLGSGGIWGIGLGNSKQSNLFLPEAYGDFIFAVLGEELGLAGALAVLLSYLILFIAGILVAKKAKDRFGQLLAFGITFSIIIYAFINISVATGLIPITGLPLPFISYGGTSVLFHGISIGMIINVALTNAKKDQQNLTPKYVVTGENEYRK